MEKPQHRIYKAIVWIIGVCLLVRAIIFFIVLGGRFSTPETSDFFQKYYPAIVLLVACEIILPITNKIACIKDKKGQDSEVEEGTAEGK